jgi:DEAD/DEAH box helicase domain-containing protein
MHEKAIYLHEARQYHVERFDYEQRKPYVRRVHCDYYSDAIDYAQVQSLEEFEREALGGAQMPWDVRVNRRGICRCRSRRCIRPRFGCISPRNSWRGPRI